MSECVCVREKTIGVAAARRPLQRFGFRVSGFGFEVSRFGIRDSDVVFRV